MWPRAPAVRAGVFVTVVVSRPATADPASVAVAPAQPTREASRAVPSATAAEPISPNEPVVFRVGDTDFTDDASSSSFIRFDGPVFFSVGYIGSLLGGANPSNAHGVEASLIGYVNRGADRSIGIGLGTLFQYQQYDGPESHGRWAAGFELASPIGGVELMYAHRNGAGSFDTTHGIALGPYLSLVGVLNLAGRIVVPLSPGGERGYGVEYGITLGIKLPLRVAGRFWTNS
jgi:hypothetical protein